MVGQVATIVHQIQTADGKVVATGKPGQTLCPLFVGRCKADNHRVLWGDHYRVMQRRKDPENVIMKCKNCGEVLIKLA